MSGGRIFACFFAGSSPRGGCDSADFCVVVHLVARLAFDRFECNTGGAARFLVSGSAALASAPTVARSSPSPTRTHACARAFAHRTLAATRLVTRGPPLPAYVGCCRVCGEKGCGPEYPRPGTRASSGRGGSQPGGAAARRRAPGSPSSRGQEKVQNRGLCWTGEGTHPWVCLPQKSCVSVAVCVCCMKGRH